MTAAHPSTTPDIDSETDLVLDTDIGSDVDDLLALAVIFASPSLSLRGVTTVYGDTTLRAQMVARACRLSDHLVRPIIPGLTATRSGREVWWAGHEGALMPDLGSESIDADADAVRLLAQSETVIAVGPLTNLAAAVDSRSTLCRDFYVMGGRFTGPGAEHNIRSDADAAAAVFASGVRTTVVGLEQTTRVRVGNEVADALAAHGEFGALLAAELRQFWDFAGETSNVPHDPIAVLMLTDPELFAFAIGRITVVTEGDDAGVTTFVAEDGGPHRIVVDLDEAAVAETITARLVAASSAPRGR